MARNKNVVIIIFIIIMLLFTSIVLTKEINEAQEKTNVVPKKEEYKQDISAYIKLYCDNVERRKNLNPLD